MYGTNVAGNPRIDDLRKRIEKEPGSRLFAQLAEELRKDGELEDAIRVARAGLQSHPNYPSARMTLGRALLDTGDWAAARTEFELVLKGAPDNILASRYLADCLESLGDRAGAIARYKATLAMAPGEKHVVARLHELEGTSPPPAFAKAAPVPATGSFRAMPGLRPGTKTMPPGESARPVVPTPSPAVPPPPPPAPPAPPPQNAAPAPVAAPPPPIPLSTVEGEMELETSRGHEPAPAPPPPGAESAASPFAPIPLVAADETFELERPYESPHTPAPTPSAAPPPAAVSAAPEIEEQEFELEAPHEAPSAGWKPTIPPLPVVEEAPSRPPSPPPSVVALPVAPPPAAPAAPAAPAPPAPPAAVAPAASGPATLTSPTLGELYFNQGFTDKAIEVYRELISREPGNERLAARLRELEKLQRALSGGEPAVAATPGPADEPPPAADGTTGERRQAIERTIVRLEGLLSAIRKG